VFEETIKETIDYVTDSNGDGISDYYSSKIYTGELRAGNGTSFKGIDFNLRKDYDYDWIPNGDEIEVVGYRDQVYLKMHSDPTKKDTDGDGYNDNEDPNPLTWNVSDRDLAMVSSIAYSFVPEGLRFEQFSSGLEKQINDRFNGAAHLEEIKRWKVMDTWYAKGGLQIMALEIDNNIVVVYRGTEPGGGDKLEGWKDWFNNGTTWALGLSTQTPMAKKFMKNIMKNNKNKDFYVTGHSLGGHLTYNAGAQGISYDKSSIKGIVTFNGLGLTLGLTLIGDLWDEKQLLKLESKIRNHKVKGDPVSKGFLGFTTFHYGTTTTYNMDSEAPDKHNLYTFFKELKRGKQDL